MKQLGTTLSLLVLIAAGVPPRSQAGFTTVDASPATLGAVSPATLAAGSQSQIGGGIVPLVSTTIYDNTENFQGSAYAAGGTAMTSLGNTSTVIADDINAAAGTAGTAVNSITFSVFNGNATAVTADALLFIYDSDGTNGGPGTLLAALEFAPISFTGNNIVSVLNFTSASTIFTTPSGTFWVGEAFTDAGTGSATTAQLNNLGVGLYDPPTIGSSQDAFFQANDSSTANTSNPPGGFYYFGGTPVANFGFSFSGTTPAAVPEPSSLVLTGLAGLILAFAKARNASITRRHEVI